MASVILEFAELLCHVGVARPTIVLVQTPLLLILLLWTPQLRLQLPDDLSFDYECSLVRLTQRGVFAEVAGAMATWLFRSSTSTSTRLACSVVAARAAGQVHSIGRRIRHGLRVTSAVSMQ